MRVIEHSPWRQRFSWLLPLLVVAVAATVWLMQPSQGFFGGSPTPYLPDDWPEGGYRYAAAAWDGDYEQGVYRLADADVLVPVSRQPAAGEETLALLRLRSLLERWLNAAGHEPLAEGLRHPLELAPELLSLTLEDRHLLLNFDHLPAQLHAGGTPQPIGLRALHYLLQLQPHADIQHLLLFADGEQQGPQQKLAATPANRPPDGQGDGASDEEPVVLTAFLPVAAGERLYLAPYALGPQVSVEAWLSRVLRQYSAETEQVAPGPPFFRTTPSMSITLAEDQGLVRLSTRLDNELVQDPAAATLLRDSIAASLLAHPDVNGVRFELDGEPSGLLSETVAQQPQTTDSLWLNPLPPASE